MASSGGLSICALYSVLIRLISGFETPLAHDRKLLRWCKIRKAKKPKKEPTKELLYLGERIETARKDSGLTQQELAVQCHRGHRHIQNIKAGLANPSFDVLSDIIHRRVISADTLFFPDMTKQEEESRHLLNKLAACTEDERQIILKTLDCMAEQFLRRRYRSPEEKSEWASRSKNLLFLLVSVCIIIGKKQISGKIQARFEQDYRAVSTKVESKYHGNQCPNTHFPLFVSLPHIRWNKFIADTPGILDVILSCIG